MPGMSARYQLVEGYRMTMERMLVCNLPFAPWSLGSIQSISAMVDGSWLKPGQGLGWRVCIDWEVGGLRSPFRSNEFNGLLV